MEDNRVLVEWAGFRLVTIDTWEKAERYGKCFGLYPDGKVFIHKSLDDSEAIKEWDMFDFTESLDACFKWLVPKLDQSRYYKVLSSIFLKQEKPALALCKAILKLIGN